MITLSGFRQPALIVDALVRGSREVDGGGARFAVDADRDGDLRAGIHLVGEGAVLQPVDHASHRLLRVVLHVAHVGLDNVEPVLRHNPAQLLHALFVGGDLGLEIGQVVAPVAGRVARRGEQRLRFLFEQPAFGDELEIVDQHALFVDVLRIWRQRRRGDAADLRVMAARGDVEQQLALGLVEHRGDDRDVGQMRAAVVGRIQHEHVARAHVVAAQPRDGAHAFAH
jgi:hypothetical protein